MSRLEATSIANGDCGAWLSSNFTLLSRNISFHNQIVQSASIQILHMTRPKSNKSNRSDSSPTSASGFQSLETLRYNRIAPNQKKRTDVTKTAPKAVLTANATLQTRKTQEAAAEGVGSSSVSIHTVASTSTPSVAVLEQPEDSHIGKEIIVDIGSRYALELAWRDSSSIIGAYTGPINAHEQPHGADGVIKYYDETSNVILEVYEGEWASGMKCGDGKETWEDGCVYEGTFESDHRHGRGVFWGSEGDIIYDGEWSRDNRHGHGIQFFSDGSKYTGEWRYDSMEGHGVLKCTDGSVYEGPFKSGKKHGSGIQKWDNGKVYEGMFVDGQQQGRGTLTFPDDRRYSGEFLDNKMHGKSFRFRCICHCKCMLLSLVRETGSGTKSWPSGEQYVGQWFDNKCHGTGTRSWPDGSFYCGEWKAGKYHGIGTYFWPSGNCYEGEWVCGLKEGRGIFTWHNDGKRYEGEYNNGKKCGNGTFSWPDGSEYKGEWRNNQRHGMGEQIDAYGIVSHFGLWRANRPCSPATREMGSC